MNTAITSHFQKHDPIMADLIIKTDSLQLEPITINQLSPEFFFERLCESIIGQQLSEKAGDTIWKRFQTLFQNGDITPEQVLALPHESIRGIGASNSKVTYLKNWAQSVSDGTIKLSSLPELGNEEVITLLTKVKGIGRWTAEMFLMFSLGREDVFSHGDLGLKNAIKRWYPEVEDNPTKDQFEAITQKWSPYRTYASRILWRSLLLPKA